ncbi:MAG: hypothetical protein GEU28_05535 [Dehalococcoidia bacterium]|nr:hypothetical protein [Dehalococcoidia bacterium]
MDLETWRDLAFVIFAVLLLLVLLALLVASGALLFAVLKLRGVVRSKLAETRPRVSAAREMLVKAERGVDRASDGVASPFIKLNGLIGAVRRGATTLVTGRDGPS